MSAVHPRLQQVVLDAADARRSAEFWRALLGLSYRPGQEPPPAGEDDPAGRDWLNLLAPDGSPLLAVQQVERLPRSTWPAADVPQQLHLCLTAEDVEQLDAVHARALELGAVVLEDRRDDPEEALRVHADPDGHPFCVYVP